VHATGHEKRLDRSHAFGAGRANYSKEELVAEFGAAIIGAMLGFDGAKEIENHAAYLRGWLKPLKDDPTFLASAASAAQKAVDRIMVKAGVREPEPVAV
jgi:antirestriction protein ArdC